MAHFSEIIIIYNPHSTGNGKALAHELRRTIRDQLPKQTVTVVPTKYAGHAQRLAYTYAKASPKPLIFSASGDGGYHEVINGLLEAQYEGAHPTSGLLPAGNANDHYHSVHDIDTAEQIVAGHAKQIDVLKLTGVSGGKTITRYAHSYIGFGLTPKVGRELNKTALNRIKEVAIVLRVLTHLRPTRLKVNGKICAYNSLVFSNIPKMSKVFELSKQASASDGKFEITALRRSTKLRLIRALIKASTVGFTGNRHAVEFSCKTVRATLVQLDGEIIRLDKNSDCHITIVPGALRCVV